MKKFLLIFVALSILATAGYIAFRRSRTLAPGTPQSTPQTEQESKKPAPVKASSVELPKPIVTSGFVIGVSSVSKSVNGQEIGLTVTNDGDTVLELNPNEQFRLAGLTSHIERKPIAEKTTAAFSGTLAVDAQREGTIYFDAFTDEQSELRFYTDGTQANYIVVPLITLSSNR